MKRWIIIGSLAATLALAGCSKDDPAPSGATTTVAGASGDASTTTKAGGGAPVATLSLLECSAVAGEGGSVVLSGNAEEAAKLKTRNPPSDVISAVDVLVAAGGLKVKVDGSNQTEVAAAATLNKWVDDVCPD